MLLPARRLWAGVFAEGPLVSLDKLLLRANAACTHPVETQAGFCPLPAAWVEGRGAHAAPCWPLTLAEMGLQGEKGSGLMLLGEDEAECGAELGSAPTQTLAQNAVGGWDGTRLDREPAKGSRGDAKDAGPTSPTASPLNGVIATGALEPFSLACHATLGCGGSRRPAPGTQLPAAALRSLLCAQLAAQTDARCPGTLLGRARLRWWRDWLLAWSMAPRDIQACRLPLGSPPIPPLPPLTLFAARTWCRVCSWPLAGCPAAGRRGEAAPVPGS